MSEITNNIKKELPRLISPQALWTVQSVPFGNKTLVVVDVPEGMDKPYVVGGAIYLRRSSEVVPATRDEISDLILKRSLSAHRWERQMAIGADYEDLDQELIRETALMAVKSERWQGTPDDTRAFLHAHGLIAPAGVTNAAVVLYGKEPSRVLPQARVRLLVLPAGKTGDHYAVDRIFKSNLLDVAKEIPAVLIKYVGGVESVFSPKNWQRSDRPLLPMTALREGVMNALAHRDYQSNGTVVISISPTEVRISNPGSLPDKLKPSDLKRDHPSIPRNPDIAHICFLHGLIEKVGRGTQRIVEDCLMVNLKQPRWNSSSLDTTLIFSFPGKLSSKSHPNDLTDRQSKILGILKRHGTLKTSKLLALLGDEVTDRTIRNDLVMLVDQGWVARQGNGPSTTYALVNQDPQS